MAMIEREPPPQETWRSKEHQDPRGQLFPFAVQLLLGSGRTYGNSLDQDFGVSDFVDAAAAAPVSCSPLTGLVTGSTAGNWHIATKTL